MSVEERRLALNAFFVEREKKALRQIELAVKNREEALDILQDVMIRLAQKYSDQIEAWPMLFQRIIQNAIRDWYRKQKVRKILHWFGSEEEFDALNQGESGSEESPNIESASPQQEFESAREVQRIENAVASLPLRQQQAFILRAWWGHDTQETAELMQCSSGSVKTHYSRAIEKLKNTLGAVPELRSAL